MIPALERAHDSARFIIVTLVLTLAYLALQQFWLGLVEAGGRAGIGGDEAAWIDEARQLAAQSAPMEAKLSPTHRVDVWRLGFLLGYSTELIGSFAFSPAERQQQARTHAAPMLTRANAIAGSLRVGPVDVLPVRTAQDFGNLSARVEADESGIDARVQTRLSPRARHLFLLGMHCGMFAEALESGTDESPLPIPQTTLIARHATLAGIAPELWKPLQRTAAGDTRAQIAGKYRSAMSALDSALSDGTAATAPPAE